MTAAELKKALDELGMEYEEHDYGYKAVEVYFTDEQIEDFGENEAHSIVCHGGWSEVEEHLKDLGIIIPDKNFLKRMKASLSKPERKPASCKCINGHAITAEPGEHLHFCTKCEAGVLAF